MSRTAADLSMHLNRLCYRAPNQRETIDMIALDCRRMRRETKMRVALWFALGIVVGLLLGGMV